MTSTKNASHANDHRFQAKVDSKKVFSVKIKYFADVNFINILRSVLSAFWRKDIQSNSVIANSTGPSVFVRYNREFVITVKIYVVN